MSAAAGWMEGLAPLIQNLSNVAGTGDRARDAALRDDYNYSLEKAANIPRIEMASRVAGAKAAGLHPLAALGVNVGSYNSPVVASGTEGMSSAMQSYGRQQRDPLADENARLQNELLRGQVREQNAHADIAQQTAAASALRVAGQPGNGPVVQLEPNRVTRTLPGQPMQAQGVNPSQEKYSVPDYWTGKPVEVDMPSEKFGQVMENSGEFAAAIMAAPYVAKSLFAQYLQTPLEAAKNNSELYRFMVNPRSLLAPKLYYKERR